ncbi:restriction endonuclease subunit S [Cupriavidus gilardii]|uniref:restriction endonuclease subunit S n=1 Tax=Burkholderiales TaxID=80840 RepID=UPI000B40F59D|nr:restriction endonuclease subunit S [Pigmentiphaga sp. NML080357]OVZ63780.1 restriction endonuclease subunit S [Pigmentiphaga sp. NML080357]
MAMASAYPKYQPLDSRWLPRVPEHWSMLRAKNFLREIDDRSKTGEETLLSMRMQRGLVPHNDVSVKRIAPENLIGYKKAQPDDLVLNRMQAGNAMFFRNRQPGLVSPDYAVFRLLRDDNPEYLGHLFRSWPMRGLFRSESKGLGTGTSGFLRLYSDRFAALEIPLPPRPEQDQIVAYLRAQDAHIARFIRAKRELIKLLTEQKLAIIDRAVTRGLNPAAPLKPSGIAWLGDVPEHWGVLKLKFATKRIVGGSTPKSDESSYWDGGIVWVTPRDISKTDSLHTSLRTITAAGLQSCAATLVPPGSIIITSRAPVGNVAIARVELCTNQGCKAVVPASDIAISDFLYLLLLRMKERLQVLANGTTFAEIGTWVLANEFIPVPPVSEQQAICRWIADECHPLDEAIARAEQEIKLIREYRDRLIADVVTGQIDVRGWQPGPDDAASDEELAALGDDEAGNSDEEEADGDN